MDPEPPPAAMRMPRPSCQAFSNRLLVGSIMDLNQEKPVILYFGNDWFADNRTSSHHIARWLAKRYRVYYLECPGLRSPKRSGRDAKKLLNKVWRFLQGANQVDPNLKVRTLLQLPFHR